MSSKMIGAIVAIVGLLVLLVSLLSDMIGVSQLIEGIGGVDVGGNVGVFGPLQIAGTVIGAVVLIVGIAIYLRQRQT